MTTLRVTNASKNSVLAIHAAVADTPEIRKQGLIGSPGLQPGEGLFIPECNAIHTVELQFRIDVVFIDVFKHRVVKTVCSAVPGCHFNTLVPVQICAALELPAGTIQETGTQPGDVLVIMSSGHATARELNWIGAL